MFLKLKIIVIYTGPDYYSKSKLMVDDQKRVQHKVYKKGISNNFYLGTLLHLKQRQKMGTSQTVA